MRRAGIDQRVSDPLHLVGRRERDALPDFGRGLIAVHQRPEYDLIARLQRRQRNEVLLGEILDEEMVAHDARIEPAHAGKDLNGGGSADQRDAERADIGDEDRPFLAAGEGLARHIEDHHAENDRDADFDGEDELGEHAAPRDEGARDLVSRVDALGPRLGIAVVEDLARLLLECGLSLVDGVRRLHRAERQWIEQQRRHAHGNEDKHGQRPIDANEEEGSADGADHRGDGVGEGTGDHGAAPRAGRKSAEAEIDDEAAGEFGARIGELAPVEHEALERAAILGLGHVEDELARNEEERRAQHEAENRRGDHRPEQRRLSLHVNRVVDIGDRGDAVPLHLLRVPIDDVDGDRLRGEMDEVERDRERQRLRLPLEDGIDEPTDKRRVVAALLQESGGAGGLLDLDLLLFDLFQHSVAFIFRVGQAPLTRAFAPIPRQFNIQQQERVRPMRRVRLACVPPRA